MKATKRNGGLVKKFPIDKRCSRCDYLLVHSKWNGVKVVLAKYNNHHTPYLCIQCTIRLSFYTEDELNKAVPKRMIISSKT